MNEKAAISGPVRVYNAAQADTVLLLQDLEATTAKLGDAIKTADTKYQHLLTKYNALRSSGAGQILGVSNALEAAVEPYILVLVDAQSHQFRENYVHGAESGGVKTAASLKGAAQRYMVSSKGEGTELDVEIHVYANLKTLSVDAAEQYAARNPAFGKPTFSRSLGAFAAGFSRDDAAIDYVDVAEDTAVEHKICGLFKKKIRDPRCQHILFGASGSAEYVRVLEEHMMLAEKITLILRGDEDTSLVHLGLQSVMLSEVFEPLARRRVALHVAKEFSNKSVSDQSSSYTNTTPSAPRSNQEKVLKTRVNSLHTPLAHRALLPLKGPPGTIPVNGTGHRLDFHMDTPTSSQWKEFNTSFATRKPCDYFHLGQRCYRKDCTYDHGPMNLNERYCYRFLRREWPCKNGGNCRDRDCSRGHICHYEACEDGRVPSCKMPACYHGIDPTVADWVTPNKEFEGLDANGSSPEIHEGPIQKEVMIVENLIDL